MAAHLIFSSKWLVNPLEIGQVLDDLQFTMMDRLTASDNDTLLITTTHSFETGKRDFWVVDTENEYCYEFYQDLVNHKEGGILDIYEDEDGYMFARYTFGAKSSIWKFHFVNDIETIIEHTLAHVDSDKYEDFRDLLEYGLQDAGYLEHNERLRSSIVQDGADGNAYLSLPYMKDTFLRGTIFYDNREEKWLLEDGTIDYIESFDTYIKECLF